MSETAPPDAVPDQLLLRLEGFEGPLDLLLELARGQKVDLAKISILALVEQYLAVVERARKIRIELAADWLVMAAWLTWLKSRLLVPEDPQAEEAEIAAEVLTARLAELQAMQAAAAWLGQRLQLGRDVHRRGSPESLTETDRSGLALDLPMLLRAYLVAIKRGTAGYKYSPKQLPLWSVQDALARLGRMLGSVPPWASLEAFLPDQMNDPLQRRAAMSATLLASLELARGGGLELRQEHAFGPILVGPGSIAPPDDDDGELP